MESASVLRGHEGLLGEGRREKKSHLVIIEHHRTPEAAMNIFCLVVCGARLSRALSSSCPHANAATNATRRLLFSFLSGALFIPKPLGPRATRALRRAE